MKIRDKRRGSEVEGAQPVSGSTVSFARRQGSRICCIVTSPMRSAADTVGVPAGASGCALGSKPRPVSAWQKLRGERPPSPHALSRQRGRPERCGPQSKRTSNAARPASRGAARKSATVRGGGGRRAAWRGPHTRGHAAGGRARRDASRRGPSPGGGGPATALHLGARRHGIRARATPCHPHAFEATISSTHSRVGTETCDDGGTEDADFWQRSTGKPGVASPSVLELALHPTAHRRRGVTPDRQADTACPPSQGLGMVGPPPDLLPVLPPAAHPTKGAAHARPSRQASGHTSRANALPILGVLVTPCGHLATGG